MKKKLLMMIMFGLFLVTNISQGKKAEPYLGFVVNNETGSTQTFTGTITFKDSDGNEVYSSNIGRSISANCHSSFVRKFKSDYKNLEVSITCHNHTKTKKHSISSDAIFYTFRCYGSSGLTVKKEYKPNSC
jgi:hypothetical protein